MGADTPGVVRLLEVILILVRHIIAIVAVPSFVVLKACEAFARWFEDVLDGGCGHATFAPLRLLAFFFFVPLAIFALPVVAELVAWQRGFGWPIGIAAAIGLAFTMHGLYFYQRNHKFDFKVLCTGAREATMDFVCMLALIVLGLTIIQLPSLCSQICDEKRNKSCRELILVSVLWLPLNIGLVPAAVLLLLFPWRWCSAWKGVSENGRLEILLHLLGGCVDAIVILLSLFTLLSPVRTYKLLCKCLGSKAEVADLRLEAMKSVGKTASDLLCIWIGILMVLMSVLAPWRLYLAICDINGGVRPIRAALFNFLWIFYDLLALFGMVIVAPTWRTSSLPWPWNMKDRIYLARYMPSGIYIGKVAHELVLNQFGELLVDIVFCSVPFLVVCGTLYRVPAMMQGIASKREPRWHIFKQCGFVLIEVPLIVFSLVLIATPWRLVWLIKDVSSTTDNDFRRLAVFHHVAKALADLLALVSLGLLLFLAPWRFCSAEFRDRLQSGSAHVGKSANKQLSFRRPSPRVPEETSVIHAFHGTSKEAAEGIEQNGFIPSKYGMIGPGVYCSRDPSKAESYGPQILKLAVTIGKVCVIEYQRHPNQQNWKDKGYDVAWVPAGCGMVPSNREEGCIYDPSAVRVTGRYIKTRHPHTFCVVQLITGVLDLFICFLPIILAVLTLYRLPGLCRMLSDPKTRKDPWVNRWVCVATGVQIITEILAAISFVFVAIINPFRMIHAVRSLCGHSKLQDLPNDASWKEVALVTFFLAVVDWLVLLCVPVIFVGFRLRLLVLWMREKKIETLCDWFQLGVDAQFEVISTGFAALIDLPFLIIAILVGISWRNRTLCGGLAAERRQVDKATTADKRVMTSDEGWAMFHECRKVAFWSLLLVVMDVFLSIGVVFITVLIVQVPTFGKRAYLMTLEWSNAKRDETSRAENVLGAVHWANVDDETKGDGTDRDDARELAREDAARGFNFVSRNDMASTGSERISLSFYVWLILDSAYRTVLYIPCLIFLPILVFYPLGLMIQRFSEVRYGVLRQELPAPEPEATTETPIRRKIPITSYGDFIPKAYEFIRSPSTDPVLQGEKFVTVTLAILPCILLNELATIVFFIAVLFVITPLSLGYSCWPTNWKESSGGATALAFCHNVQGLVLPAILLICLALPALPLILWLEISFHPWRVAVPEEPIVPLAAFCAIQAVWFFVVCATPQLLLRSPKTGAFKPTCTGSARGVLRLFTGKARLWRSCIDPVIGGGVRLCFQHRRTCWCAGELLLGVWLLPFFGWPLVFPIIFAQNEPLEKAIIWWVVAGLLSTFFLFHAVRLGRAYWRDAE